MDFSTIIGIVAGFVLVVFGIGISNIGNFIDSGSLLIVFGGTFAALIASYPPRILKQLPKQFKIITRQNPYNAMEYIDNLQELAVIARKNGLLALEDKANEMEDPFFKEGLMLIVDATTPGKVKEILENNFTEGCYWVYDEMYLCDKGYEFHIAVDGENGYNYITLQATDVIFE